MTQPLRIDIVSDVVCPWCIIGYKRLEKALKQLEGRVDVDLHWHPFELNPDMPKAGENLRAHLGRKYGTSAEDSIKMRDMLSGFGADLGFTFNYQDDSVIYNTFLAHQLLHWAGEQGNEAQLALKLSLFDSYFTQGQDVTEETVLLDAVEKAGLDREEAAVALSEQRYAEAVRDNQRYWLEGGVQAVPSVVFNQKYLVSGAQEASTLVDVIEQVLAHEAA